MKMTFIEIMTSLPRLAVAGRSLKPLTTIDLLTMSRKRLLQVNINWLLLKDFKYIVTIS
jgi:hypothetical protein